MMGSTHGLVGRALTTYDTEPLANGPAHITAGDSGSGLTPARVAVAVLGEPGAWILLIMLFMAIVSTGCAEIIAVATIMTYDVYCEYLNWDLKTERMNNRQIYYATVLGKNADLGVSKARAPREMIKVEEIALKSVEKIMWQDSLKDILKKLEAANILPSTRDFTPEETKAIETTLVGYAETDGSVTYEMLYFAVQSQVLCKLSGEAGIVLRMMKFFCICFAVFMGFLANFLQSLLSPYGRGLGFVYCSMGIFVGPAVAPAAMAILMESASPKWCTIGAISGLVFGIITWLATAQYMYEEVTIATLDNDDPFLYSNLVSMCFPAWLRSLEALQIRTRSSNGVICQCSCRSSTTCHRSLRKGAPQSSSTSSSRNRIISLWGWRCSSSSSSARSFRECCMVAHSSSSLRVLRYGS